MGQTRAVGEILNHPNSVIIRVKPLFALADGGWWGNEGAASASFRGRPLTSAERVDRGWKMGDYGETQRRNSLNFGQLGGEGEILMPSASASLRGSPWTSAACVGGRWKMGAVEL